MGRHLKYRTGAIWPIVLVFSILILLYLVGGSRLLSLVLVYGLIGAFVAVGAGILLFLLLWNLRMTPSLFRAMKSLLTGDGRYRMVGSWTVVDTKPWLSNKKDGPRNGP
jgi:hypothetical protein